VCAECGASMRESARYCPRCGHDSGHGQSTPTPPEDKVVAVDASPAATASGVLQRARPARRQVPRRTVVGVVAVTVLGLGGLGAILLVSRQDGEGALLPASTERQTTVEQGAQPATTVSSAPTTEAVAVETQPATAPTTVEATTTSRVVDTPAPQPSPPAVDPLTQLEQLRAGDRPIVEGSLVDLWVPQVSSKYLGLVTQGVTFGYPEILYDHLALRGLYGAVLLWSGDYTSFTRGDAWITVVPQAFDLPADALAWCFAHGLDNDRCYAKRVSHIFGPEDSTLHP
jgi:zinc-ribbon domain